MKNNKENCDLKNCMYCQLCIPEWLPAIGDIREMVNIKKGGILFKEGKEITGMYFVHSGVVKVHKQWGQKELIVRFAKKKILLVTGGWVQILSTLFLVLL